ncbi:MAG: NAD(P)-dependent glycerol-3-phosphate dehydrogenase [Burkholderiales bacterium]|nr:NAD(P)-dependent glycerol-3-phosphate dehydrogenase [Burkholderiales bacterium]
MRRVAILGAGAWGTALAVHLAARAARPTPVVLWTRDPAQASALAQARCNVRYLPGIALPPDVAIASDTATAAACDLFVAAVPAAALVDVATRFAPAAKVPLVWLSKGFVTAPDAPAGVALAHEHIGGLWPTPVGAISGPSFADEVARGLPTALVVAATVPQLADDVASLLRGDTLRAYRTSDIVGVEIGGAVKNVLAIAAGASDGLGYGHNARAALITRGLAETGRLLTALGGARETLMGLAGLGDLVLTCTGDLSRNRRVGLALAQGKALPQILAELGHVAEGVSAARATRRLAAQCGVDMPICTVVDRVLHEALPVRDAVAQLLTREPRSED